MIHLVEIGLDDLDVRICPIILLLCTVILGKAIIMPWVITIFIIMEMLM